MSRIFIMVLAGFIFALPGYAQEEISLRGKVVADSLQESSIHIINITQKTGTVNSSSGSFRIQVQHNDTLLFSSLQYKKVEIVITPAILQQGYLEMLLEAEVNELDEVNISNIDLTGNINTDLSNIEVVKGLGTPVKFSYAQIKDVRYEADINDPQAAPHNLAFQENQVMLPGGMNLLPLVDLVAGLFRNKQKISPAPPVSTERTSSQIRGMFDDDFFIYSLEIDREHIKDFTFYLDDVALDYQLLRGENRMALIEYLIVQSKMYKSLNERE